MFLFLKLYLAHLVGDFVLQFEELYSLKVRNVWGHIGHVLIHVLVSLLLTIPYWHQPQIWFFIAALGTVHLMQDLLKYNLQKKHPAFTLPLFVLDQVFHFLTVSCILLLPVSRLELGFPSSPSWNLYYSQSLWTVYAIAFLIATFGGSYLLHNFRKNYVPGSRPDHLITSFEMSHAIIERSLWVTAILFPGHPLLWAAVAVAGLSRLAFPKLRNAADFLMSCFWAASVGLLFSRWV